MDKSRLIAIATTATFAIVLGQGNGSPARASTPLSGFRAAQQLHNFFDIGRRQLEEQLTRGQLFLPDPSSVDLDVAPDAPIQDQDLEKLEGTGKTQSSQHSAQTIHTKNIQLNKH